MKPPDDVRATALEAAVITGLSGAGRSEAAKALEDLGWFVVDNLPPALIDKMVSLALSSAPELRRMAFVIDVRGGAFFEEAAEALEKLKKVARVRMVFVEAAEDVLVRRFDHSRRLHPMATHDNVLEGIRREQELLSQFRSQADVVIDTSEIPIHGLRSKMSSYFGDDDPAARLRTTIMSFGYKFGLPLDADLVFDVRFLPNPHWVEDLRPLDGRAPEVRDYVLRADIADEFLARLRDLLAVLLPGYAGEGRQYLTIAVGCTGGRHRSVVLAEEVAQMVRDKGFNVHVSHRDADRSATAS